MIHQFNSKAATEAHKAAGAGLDGCEKHLRGTEQDGRVRQSAAVLSWNSNSFSSPLLLHESGIQMDLALRTSASQEPRHGSRTNSDDTNLF